MPIGYIFSADIFPSDFEFRMTASPLAMQFTFFYSSRRAVYSFVCPCFHCAGRVWYARKAFVTHPGPPGELWTFRLFCARNTSDRILFEFKWLRLNTRPDEIMAQIMPPPDGKREDADPDAKWNKLNVKIGATTSSACAFFFCEKLNWKIRRIQNAAATASKRRWFIKAIGAYSHSRGAPHSRETHMQRQHFTRVASNLRPEWMELRRSVVARLSVNHLFSHQKSQVVLLSPNANGNANGFSCEFIYLFDGFFDVHVWIALSSVNISGRRATRDIPGIHLSQRFMVKLVPKHKIAFHLPVSNVFIWSHFHFVCRVLTEALSIRIPVDPFDMMPRKKISCTACDTHTHTVHAQITCGFS